MGVKCDDIVGGVVISMDEVVLVKEVFMLVFVEEFIWS